MLQTKMIKELNKLTNTERLIIIEASLHLIRDDINMVKHSQPNKKRQLSCAAKALLADYSEDDEMTVFTSLDGEDFHAHG
jgi:hypothetical protein